MTRSLASADARSQHRKDLLRDGGRGVAFLLEPEEGPRERADEQKAEIAAIDFLDHIHTPALLRARSAQLFDWITEGRLRVRVGGEYPLAKAAKAQADMESRKTTGKLLLVP